MMKPGRELDALVAEKVMGVGQHDLDYHRWHCLPIPPGTHPSYCSSERNEKGEESHLRCLIKSYSTKIEEAWEVVEKMRGCTHAQWLIWIAALNNGERLLRGNANGDAPYFICLAARKAVNA